MPDDGLELSMPFVVCVTNGGPLDDTAFVAGWHCCQINETLQAQDRMTLEESVLVVLLPQLDLLAMKHGYVMEAGHSRPDDTYVDVTFTWVGIGEAL